MDVYSFGVLLCEMCIQELPDPDRRVLEEQVSRVTDHVFQHLILRCITWEPEARPTMERVINALDPQAHAFVKIRERRLKPDLTS